MLLRQQKSSGLEGRHVGQHDRFERCFRFSQTTKICVDSLCIVYSQVTLYPIDCMAADDNTVSKKMVC